MAGAAASGKAGEASPPKYPGAAAALARQKAAKTNYIIEKIY